MAYRWDEAGIVHHEFVHQASGWKLYRRKGGSFQRLLDETGIHPTQYGSVYEKRNVLCKAELAHPVTGHLWREGMPSVSYVIQGIGMPDFAG